MTMEENKALIRKLVEEIFNKHQPDAADIYISPDYIQHDPGVIPGREGFKQSFRTLFAAFPDWHVELGPQIAEGDIVVSFQTHTGTHLGEFRGIPATGKRVVLETADMFRIANGQSAEHWHVAAPEKLKWMEFLLL